MNQLDRYRQERAFLLYLAKTAPARKPKNQLLPVHHSNYAAVYTSPTNNGAPIYGPCLIWRHGLNQGGYGVTSQDGRQVLAHRAAYEISRGSMPPNTRILHMCNRRSCIQPSHLYAGTQQENNDDRKAKTEGFYSFLSMFEKHNRLVKECVPHIWPEPPQTQLSNAPEPEHKCNFVVSAGITELCEVCYQPMQGTSLWRFLREMDDGIDHQQREQENRQRYLELNRNYSLRHKEN